MFAASKPLPHRHPVKEQNSRGKNSFLVRSLTFHDSLTELCNQCIDTKMYPLPLSAKQKENIHH